MSARGIERLLGQLAVSDNAKNDDWWKELHPIGKFCFLIVFLGTGLFFVIAGVFVILGLFH